MSNNGNCENYGKEWETPENDTDVQGEKGMNMNNDRYELCLDFVHVYKIAFYRKKVLTKSWKILYTAFT